MNFEPIHISAELKDLIAKGLTKTNEVIVSVNNIVSADAEMSPAVAACVKSLQLYLNYVKITLTSIENISNDTVEYRWIEKLEEHKPETEDLVLATMMANGRINQHVGLVTTWKQEIIFALKQEFQKSLGLVDNMVYLTEQFIDALPNQKAKDHFYALGLIAQEVKRLTDDATSNNKAKLSSLHQIAEQGLFIDTRCEYLLTLLQVQTIVDDFLAVCKAWETAAKSQT